MAGSAEWSGPVPLTTVEFRLLLELVKHPGIALSRDSLTRAAQVGNYRPLDRAVEGGGTRVTVRLPLN